VPAAKRVRTPATDEWDDLQLRFTWPEQHQYELIRPVVLFGLTAADRGDQTGVAARTIARRADRFATEGFAALVDQAPPQRLSDDIRRALCELKAAYPAFGLRELAAICAVRFDRHLSHHTRPRHDMPNTYLQLSLSRGERCGDSDFTPPATPECGFPM